MLHCIINSLQFVKNDALKAAKGNCAGSVK